MRRKATLYEMPVPMVELVEEHRERLSRRINKISGYGESILPRHFSEVVVGMVAPDPDTHGIGTWRNRNRRGCLQLDDALLAGNLVGEMRHAVAEEDALAGGREHSRSARRLARPTVGRDERQQHRPVIGCPVGPVEFIRTRPGRARQYHCRRYADRRCDRH